MEVLLFLREKDIRIVRIILSLAIAFIISACSPIHFSPTSFTPPDLPNLERVRIAFVLGGGGAKAIAHVGVIEELLRAGIYPDLIVGCSAGAIVGGLFADQPDINRLKDILMEKRREHFLNISLFHLPFGLSNGSALQDFLESHLKSKYFNELKIPFIAVATNLQEGTMVPFGTGRLEPTIRASAAFPGMLYPVIIDGCPYVDGGVTENIPAEVARRMGAEYVIAVELEADLDTSPPTNVLGIFQRSLEIGLKYQGTRASKYANYIIKVPLTGVGIFEDNRNEYAYNQGREAGKIAAEKILKQIPREAIHRSVK